MKTVNGQVPVRGLEGVIAAETSISYVDGVHGRLLYQGYDIHDIAEAMSYSETLRIGWGNAAAQSSRRDAQADAAPQPSHGRTADCGQHVG